MTSDEKPIKSIINELLNTYRLTGKIDELKIWSNWGEIVGIIIAKNTKKLQLKGTTLKIYVESAPLKNELIFHRTVLIEKINLYFNKQVVNEIQIM